MDALIILTIFIKVIVFFAVLVALYFLGKYIGTRSFIEITLLILHFIIGYYIILLPP